MSSKFRVTIALGGLFALMAMSGSASAAAPLIKSYNSIPSHIPGNVVSVGFEATSASELGDEVTLADPTPHLRRVQVVMSSWACQSGSGVSCLTGPGATFTLPITLHIYAGNTGPLPGALLVSQTRSFNIKYRPSANAAKCSGGNAGKWWSKKDHACYSGLAQVITFAFPSTDPDARTLLPNDVVWTVAYNTTHHGYAPIGEAAPCYPGCGYDSLNVGTEGFAGRPNAGTDVDPNGIYWNTTVAGFYCDGGAGGTGTLRLDTNMSNDCWGTSVPGFPNGLTPLATIKTS